MPVLTAAETVIYPDDTTSEMDFREIFQIRWPGVDGSAFHLCIGSQPGHWDVLSGSVGEHKRCPVDLIDEFENGIRVVYVQLITISDGSTVGPIIEIKHED